MDTHEAIRIFHTLGLSQLEILEYLATVCGVVLSLRTLKRKLRLLGLFRRKHFTDIIEVAIFIENVISDYNKLHGYKFLHLRCIQEGLVVSQETVRLLLHILDPEGIETRRSGRLRRRLYNNPGPDFLWHVDSYDKLKPYGICVNGAIDGFSRRIVWLEAYVTSSDPAVIGSYFMNAVESRRGCPKRIRADRGTENGHVENLQKYLRYNHEDEFAKRSFIYGSSNHNQRIESWWGFLRRHHAQYWMDIFHTMKDQDDFDGGFLDRNLVQFCFLKLIQDGLDEVVELWNTHRIRPSRNQVSPSGRPNTMYHLPHLHGAHHHICPVMPAEIQLCKEVCTPKKRYTCDKTVFNLCCELMDENNKFPPTNANEAKQLYQFLRHRILHEIL
ncbi:uncharacterized protein [Argopecten irradians]|uniref:uncharacterized protein n=1 Tax=Argopecten irradians TaxID=31199 RepID=UPI003713F711